ncbi:hypothetical protein BDB13_1024 [Rhodococcus sp. OK302]|nr:hypothetical protein BDB13_1024 [Rhodococcus sp. OK302]
MATTDEIPTLEIISGAKLAAPRIGIGHTRQTRGLSPIHLWQSWYGPSRCRSCRRQWYRLPNSW